MSGGPAPRRGTGVAQTTQKNKEQDARARLDFEIWLSDQQLQQMKARLEVIWDAALKELGVPGGHSTL